jgi:phosphoribosylformimino-5-aminoimidazole carboxamide ribotide isomerase
VTDVDATELVGRLSALEIACVIYTDVLRDGMVSGPNVEAVARVVTASRAPVVASGGVAALEHLEALEAVGAESAIVGRALYDGVLKLGELPRRFLVRPEPRRADPSKEGSK